MEPSFGSNRRPSWPESFGQEIQRPPVYNAEDYAEYLKKYCKFTGLKLYLNTETDISRLKLMKYICPQTLIIGI